MPARLFALCLLTVPCYSFKLDASFLKETEKKHMRVAFPFFVRACFFCIFLGSVSKYFFVLQVLCEMSKLLRQCLLSAANAILPEKQRGRTRSCHAMSRGHAPMPKKKILHELGVRGPTVLIDEYYTSCTCPCGQFLENAKKGPPSPGGSSSEEVVRARVHKTIGGEPCKVLEEIQDRDELACTQMLLSALSALRGEPWPRHLRRTINSSTS